MNAINSLGGTILLWVIGLFILYVVISTAVKEGINSVKRHFITSEMV